MGKSDAIVFNDYNGIIGHLHPESVAFLGFAGENAFTSTIRAPVRMFYDRELNNWDINDDWDLCRQFDLIVCTRCPYFARDPAEFVARCRAHLEPGGRALIDWGLGDHWRFERYKVGWVRDGEHEHACFPENYLWSCLWRTEFASDPIVQQFWGNVQGKFGYAMDDDINSVVRREVPRIVDYEFESIKFRFLWPDSPQLYLMSLVA